MIKDNKILSDKDWEFLNGNDLYIVMLKNKVKVAPENKKVSQDLTDDIIEYLNGSVENLVYYNIENTYGHLSMDIYFESVLDKENFFHFYSTAKGLHAIQK